jgi:hypothetical protein
VDIAGSSGLRLPEQSHRYRTCCCASATTCAHAEERERYSAVKRKLAAREWRYVQDYADAKSAVVEEILGRARERD